MFIAFHKCYKIKKYVAFLLSVSILTFFPFLFRKSQWKSLNYHLKSLRVCTGSYGACYGQTTGIFYSKAWLRWYMKMGLHQNIPWQTVMSHRAYPGPEFVVGNTLAKWKKLEQNEINFSQGFSQKVISRTCFVLNPLPTSSYFCHLLITFANSLNPDQARQNVRPDLDPYCLTPWWY